MSVNLARVLALPFGLLAFALRLAAMFWVMPLTWHTRSADAGLLVWLTALAASALAPVGLYLLLTRPVPRRPASFQLDDRHGGFVAPASPHELGPLVIVVLWVAPGSMVTERVPNGDGLRFAQFDYATLVSAAVVALLFVPAVVLLLVNRPRLALDPDGITVQRMTSRRRIGWNELAPGGPPPPTARKARYLTLYRTTGPTPGRYPRPEQLPVGWLHADPAFLANTIRHYVEQPAQRHNIGTEHELARLRSQLGSQGR
ncbi:hypothetical protein DLE60_16645 [Micromonospora globispora]|uniref:PH domain-containing protein n=1 Tax=Micromonospora globispora TaxID=1450148 RepID=A0A317K0D7_9ACTN|nr:PH domain-containing protein [Micromonospora globispora]PWU46265.1 hypothetical protein DLJ46_18645 [Micromonospora globispora]PWU59408.1 hypothetical protein DLE60_16645 [Micromonospora globispora]RQW93039.1 hypothetical protein DKL51_17990 [Micromonospora globispora]